MKHVTFCLLAALLAVSIVVHAQNVKPAYIGTSSDNSLVHLFLHLDRSIYQPQETIWFTSYILNREADLMRDQNTLYIALIEPVNRITVLKQRFLIQNGIGKGFLDLPDTLAAGDYWFIAYTNALLETGRQPVFRKLIRVRTGKPAPFYITSSTLLPDKDSLRVKYKITAFNGKPAAGGTFSYTLFDSTSAIGTGVKRIDASGNVTISIGSLNDRGRYRDMAVQVARNQYTKNFIFRVNTEVASIPFRLPTEPPSPLGSASRTVAIRIIPDSNRYSQRSKVDLHIQLRDSAGKPVMGVFSLAVAASRTQDPGSRWIDPSPDQPAEPLPPSAILELESLAGNESDFGFVTKDDEKITTPVELALMGDNPSFLRTDSAGLFTLSYPTMISGSGWVNYISVAETSLQRYKITLISRADTFDRVLAAVHYPLGTDMPGPEREDQEIIFPHNAEGYALQLTTTILLHFPMR